MIRLARVLMGVGAALTLMAVGFDVVSWRYLVLVALILVHSILWSHLDRLEQEREGLRERP